MGFNRPHKQQCFTTLRGMQTHRNSCNKPTGGNYLRALKRSSARGRYDGCRMRCTRVPLAAISLRVNLPARTLSSQGLARLVLTPTVGTPP